MPLPPPPAQPPTPRATPVPGFPGVYEYHSLDAFLRDLDLDGPDAIPYSRGNSSHKDSRSKSWDDNCGWDGAVQAARAGHKAYAQIIANAATLLREHMPELPGPGLSWSAAPDSPEWALDISAHVSGDPEPFRTYPETHATRTVTLSVGHTVSCAIDAHVVIRRGAVMCAVAEILAERGIDVQVHVTGLDTGRDGRDRPFGYSVPITPTPHLLAWWLAHPAARRRLGFRWIETFRPDETRTGYGVPIASNPALAKALAVDVCYLGMRSDVGESWKPFSDDETAAKHAVELVQKLADLADQSAAHAPTP